MKNRKKNAAEVISILRKNNVEDIFSDQRLCTNNSAFFAIKGNKYDGNDFIDDAINKGAKVVVTQEDICRSSTSACLCIVENIHETLEKCVHHFYPNIPENVILVTGTNGKTSVVHYIRNFLKHLGYSAASIGTLGCISDHNIKYQSNLTTPSLVDLRQTLHKLAQKNVTHVIIEASSHALQQRRLSNILAKVVVFTSFSPEHLDYHKTVDQYLKDKCIIFTNNCSNDTKIVVHEEVLPKIKDVIKGYDNVIVYGNTGKVKIAIQKSDICGQELLLQCGKTDVVYKTSIIGKHQAHNLLAATIAISQLGADISKLSFLAQQITAPPGRLERIAKNIFVDYAHNEDALKKVLQIVAEVKNMHQKIFLVFGCGGDRDKSKRAKMGVVANQLADEVIITDDNPRNEDPDFIRMAIKSSCPKGTIIPDRKAAIQYAIDTMSDCDILLVAGKGHEKYQIVKENYIPFSDKAIILECINR
ncbi:UDP-N-acetylmuramoyl-L-alanyl-D-glutamate--2,6-diaminopimelate ligase [Candidatus Sneabacter namystus]|uniref:UDP-N-acetylmuramoyl-L-alanyl-D-glutamate--2,6-diaminopimelate ligase n=1 Tax=Candidatus Sneabacter namystus TaxID=2601646 RepID=A0A5C0UHQ5_9RICK|nr:UDP-N-acetylmuramoyl-L-alanyl-D-glutamate--2,6-diaminopimelate ligase [Candidatus Sneabacter namystus]QEK39705.1 UDP-N-acetylmuramoyl-L-alanyl-D-glutamate--2,6-diaminopimelate ligase [Candidatus Sneabacter namystus]